MNPPLRIFRAAPILYLPPKQLGEKEEIGISSFEPALACLAVGKMMIGRWVAIL